MSEVREGTQGWSSGTLQHLEVGAKSRNQQKRLKRTDERGTATQESEGTRLWQRPLTGWGRGALSTDSWPGDMEDMGNLHGSCFGEGRAKISTKWVQEKIGCQRFFQGNLLKRRVENGVIAGRRYEDNEVLFVWFCSCFKVGITIAYLYSDGSKLLLKPSFTIRGNGEQILPVQARMNFLSTSNLSSCLDLAFTAYPPSFSVMSLCSSSPGSSHSLLAQDLLTGCHISACTNPLIL